MLVAVCRRGLICKTMWMHCEAAHDITSNAACRRNSRGCISLLHIDHFLKPHFPSTLVHDKKETGILEQIERLAATSNWLKTACSQRSARDAREPLHGGNYAGRVNAAFIHSPQKTGWIQRSYKNLRYRVFECLITIQESDLPPCNPVGLDWRVREWVYLSEIAWQDSSRVS